MSRRSDGITDGVRSWTVLTGSDPATVVTAQVKRGVVAHIGARALYVLQGSLRERCRLQTLFYRAGL